MLSPVSDTEVKFPAASRRLGQQAAVVRCDVETLSAPGLLVRMARLMSVSSGVALNQPFLTRVPKQTFRLRLYTDVASPSEEGALCGAALDRARLAIGDFAEPGSWGFIAAGP